MVTQYPHTLFLYKEVFSGGTSIGNDFVEVGVCREEPLGGGSELGVKDTNIIYIPEYISGIAFGNRIKVTDEKGERISGVVKRFSYDQLHCRIWL